jgi:SAM-dependent methyltransferase
MLKQIVHKLGREYIRKVNKSNAEAQKFKKHNERSIEYRFVFEAITQFRPVHVLDVGTGDTALPSLLANCGCIVTAIDNIRDYWPSGMHNKHWYVLDDDILHPSIKDKFDLITCISVIEHIEDHRRAFTSMSRLLRPSGHLLLTTPYSERHYVPDVYKLPGAAYGQDAPYICRSTSRSELDDWIVGSGLKIVDQEYWRLWSGNVWTQGDFLPLPQKTNADNPHQLTCLLFEK